MDADTGGKVLAKVLAFYALLNLAIECTGLAIFLAIEPGASVNLETKNQTEQTETLPLRFAFHPIFLRILMESCFFNAMDVVKRNVKTFCLLIVDIAKMLSRSSEMHS